MRICESGLLNRLLLCCLFSLCFLGVELREAHAFDQCRVEGYPYNPALPFDECRTCVENVCDQLGAGFDRTLPETVATNACKLLGQVFCGVGPGFPATAVTAARASYEAMVASYLPLAAAEAVSVTGAVTTTASTIGTAVEQYRPVIVGTASVATLGAIGYVGGSIAVITAPLWVPVALPAAAGAAAIGVLLFLPSFSFAAAPPLPPPYNADGYCYEMKNAEMSLYGCMTYKECIEAELTNEESDTNYVFTLGSVLVNGAPSDSCPTT